MIDGSKLREKDEIWGVTVEDSDPKMVLLVRASVVRWNDDRQTVDILLDGVYCSYRGDSGYLFHTKTEALLKAAEIVHNLRVKGDMAKFGGTKC